MDDLSVYLNSPQAPAIMGGAGLAPTLAGGQTAADADVVLAALQITLALQEQRYGHGEQPPVRVQQQQQYDGPQLRYLMTGRAVKFCTTRDEVLLQYQTLPEGRYWPVPEYAAKLQGPSGGGIVRARVNTSGHAPSAIPAALADRLGLSRHPLRAGGVVSTILFQGAPTPAQVLDEPLTVQLLAGPGAVAVEVTLPAVLVLPSPSQSDSQLLFELQLGWFDFCAAIDYDVLPLWASQFKIKESGYCFALPVVAPPPPHVYSRRGLGSSTFHITQEAYEEVLEIALARQAVLARRTAAAAAAAAAGSTEARSPAEAAAEALQQSMRVQAGPTAAEQAAAAAAAAPAVGTREWVDEWTSAPRQQQQRQQQQRGRGGRRGRGRGSSRSGRSSSRHQASHASSAAVQPAAAADSAAAGNAAEPAGSAATTTAGVYAGLDPLPEGLSASLWSDVAASSLPEGDDCCIICMDSFEEELEDGSARLVVQLRCRHTHCVLCLRQYITQRSFRRQPLRCPHCNTQV